MYSSHRMVSVFAVLLCMSCTHQQREKPRGALSSPEVQFVKETARSLGTSTPLILNEIRADGSLVQHSTTAGEAEQKQSQILDSHPDSTITVDTPVTVFHEQPLMPDENLLFSGKQEFGLNEWKSAYPLADGRGVNIGVVDDGIALGRPGLTTTAAGLRKVVRSINTSPVWQLPLHSDEAANIAETPYSSWKIQTTTAFDINTFSIKIPFQVSNCGINKYLARKPRECPSWATAFPNSDSRSVAGNLSIPALYLEDSSGKAKILVDIDGDNALSDNEIFTPLSQGGQEHILLDGRALAFDVHETQKLEVPAPELNNGYVRADAYNTSKVLTIAVPQLSSDFGSHGEGVASISAGYQIGNRNFDGVAPGAQLTDVHFGDSFGGRRYTIAEIGRALKIAGAHADIVNLSYSLFFETPASQVAMGRFLDALLKPTQALYFFSAGNNGPGRSSMNRSLTYPSFGIVVGAYLNPQMAQSTFGSLGEMGGVVSYSSRGPGIDGAAGAQLLSPLAGMYASTSDHGFGAFSGTSSATPALSGFAARLLSQIRAENLPFDREMFRQSMFTSAKRLEGVPFIDQGWGIPQLKSALEAYRSALGQAKPLPTLNVTGETTGNGVVQKGIAVRGWDELREPYTFTLAPQFAAAWTEHDQANYNEHIVLEPRAEAIRVPHDILLSRGGTQIQIAIDQSKINLRQGGEFVSEITIKSTDNNRILGIIPVTIIAPVNTDEVWTANVEIPAGDTTRIALKKPQWATHVLISTETLNPAASLCGRVGLYSPAGVRLSFADTGAKGAMLRDVAASTPGLGIYELVLEGRGNHTLCPSVQQRSVRVQWLNLRTTVQSVREAKNSTTVTLELSTDAAMLGGTLSLSSPADTEIVELRRTNGAQEWSARLPEQIGKSRSFQVGYAPSFWQNPMLWHGYRSRSLELYSDEKSLPLTEALPEDGFVKVEKSADVTFEQAAVWSFDEGVPLQGEKLLPLMFRIPRDSAAGLSFQFENIQMRTGITTSAMATVSKPWADVAGASFECEFIPWRSNVKIPCGTVEIPAP